MTLLERTRSQVASLVRPEKATPQQRQWTNVGQTERSVSLVGGAILAALGVARRDIPGLLVAGIGSVLAFRGLSGHSHTYGALGLDTAKPPQEKLAALGIHVEQAFLINRSPEDLYTFWRNFENLPRIMKHLESVRVLDDRRSHWVAKAPRFAGGKVEWDAEITRDEPNALIAWRSTPEATVANAGEVRFERAPSDRGTAVHVRLEYLPPAGRLGHWMASLSGQAPRQQIREDLRNFKRLMETGEVPTIVGQPRGTCKGTGKREGE